jgi:hypothetical protein
MACAYASAAWELSAAACAAASEYLLWRSIFLNVESATMIPP